MVRNNTTMRIFFSKKIGKLEKCEPQLRQQVRLGNKARCHLDVEEVRGDPVGIRHLAS